MTPTLRRKFPLPLGLLGVCLLLAGITLLVLAPLAAPPAATPIPLLPMQSSPTWDMLPTRSPTSTPVPTPTPTPALAAAAAPLAEFHAALLISDFKAARAAWETALALAPYEGVVWREGTRLALAQGDPALAQIRLRMATRYAAEDALLWTMWGALLLQEDAPAAAAQAYRMAVTLAPALAADLFPERWRAVRQSGDAYQMGALAQEYAHAHPEDPLTAYYQATALTAAGNPHTAIAQLVTVLNARRGAPGVLWYALGEAYAAGGAQHEAALAFEVAAKQAARGDLSFTLAGDNPARDVPLRLARAYLDAGRCADAEAVLRGLRLAGTSAWLEEAIICQTPTPTWTPWIVDPPH